MSGKDRQGPLSLVLCVLNGVLSSDSFDGILSPFESSRSPKEPLLGSLQLLVGGIARRRHVVGRLLRGGRRCLKLAGDLLRRHARLTLESQLLLEQRAWWHNHPRKPPPGTAQPGQLLGRLLRGGLRRLVLRGGRRCLKLKLGEHQLVNGGKTRSKPNCTKACRLLQYRSGANSLQSSAEAAQTVDGGCRRWHGLSQNCYGIQTQKSGSHQNYGF